MAENQLNLAVLALVALVAIIALVALVLHVAAPVSTGVGQVSAAEENVAGQLIKYPVIDDGGGSGGGCQAMGQGQQGYNVCQKNCRGTCTRQSDVYWYCCG